MGFLPASGMLWQLSGSLLPMYEGSIAATAPSPHAVSLPLILCQLAPLNQQFLALLTTHSGQAHWPTVHQRNVPRLIKMLLLWQRAALRLAVTVIEGQQETAQAAAAAAGAGVGGGQGAAAGGGASAFCTEVEQQQQGQGLPAMSSEGLLTSRAVAQLAASPALWAAAWAQLAAFCQGMYTWQGGKLKKAQPSSSSRSKSSKSSSIVGSSYLAGMCTSHQIFPDHEQVAAVFDPREISARIELLSLPAKGRPFSETALATVLRRGFTASVSFLDSALIFHGPSVLCEGLSTQEGGSGSERQCSRAGGICDIGGSSSSGRGDSGSEGNSSGGGSSSGRGYSSGRENSGDGGSSSGRGNSSGGGGGNSDGGGGGGSSNAIARAGKIISKTSTGASSEEASSCSNGRIWSSSRGGVAAAAALQLILEAAALLGVADRAQVSTTAVLLLCTMAKNCSLGPRKCLLSTRGGLVLDVLAAAARYDPGSFVPTAQNLMNIFLDGAGKGGRA